MYKKTVLPNGVRVVSETIPHVKSVTVGIWVGAGSRHESLANHGISHFIEHLLFKGTERRTARDIAEAVDAVGGQLNAFTGKEYTCYYIKVLDQHLDLALDILTDMLLYSRFSSEDIVREREVVLEEIKMYEDTPDELIHDLYTEQIWPRHPLGRNILGTVDTVTAFDRSQVLDYYRMNYTPDNIVIAAAGNLVHDALVERVERYLGSLSGRRQDVVLLPPEFHQHIIPRYRDSEQVHICMGTKGLPQNHDDIYALHVLNNILGGGISSRLFQSIREERGLAYSVYSYQSSYRDAGLFTVYAGTRPGNAARVVGLIQQELVSLKTNGTTDAELAKAKEQLKGSLLLGLESTSSRMSRLGKLELCLEQFITVDEIVRKIDAVQGRDVQALAGQLFDRQYLGLATLGPLKKINTDLIL